LFTSVVCSVFSPKLFIKKTPTNPKIIIIKKIVRVFKKCLAIIFKVYHNLKKNWHGHINEIRPAVKKREGKSKPEAQYAKHPNANIYFFSLKNLRVSCPLLKK